MNYFYPIHFDGGNRGCEAIARSTAILLDEPASRQIAYCRDVELDTRLGLSQYLTLQPTQRGGYLVDRALAAAHKLLRTKKTFELRKNYPYRSLLAQITPADRVLFTGGDMLCYEDNELIALNNWLHSRGTCTILWGCSMGPENLTPMKLQTLHHFSLIYVRESLTYEFFCSLGLQNLILLPDPAFILQPQSCALPSCFTDGKVIGLNLSNFVMGGQTLQSPFAAEALALIDHILSHTELHILLVPHVTWVFKTGNQDDRQTAHLLCQHFGNPERIHILDIDNLNYCQIRHIIAHCHAFVGARTHAVISAYSTCVPAIALGYSIKSRGIARDLGLDERLVINSKDFRQGQLLDSFHYLMEKHEAIRQHLSDVMPQYSQRPYLIREKLQTVYP